MLLLVKEPMPASRCRRFGSGDELELVLREQREALFVLFHKADGATFTLPCLESDAAPARDGGDPIAGEGIDESIEKLLPVR